MPKSKQNCVVFRCSSVRRKNPDLTFHKFPKEGEKIRTINAFGKEEIVDRRKLWIIKLRMGKKISKHMQVCSKHFTDDDYECSGWSTQRRLRSTAIPSQNLPSSSTDIQECRKSEKEKQVVVRALRYKKRETSLKIVSNCSANSSEITTLEDNGIEGLLMLDATDKSACTTLHTIEQPKEPVLKDNTVQSDCLVEQKDCGIQVDTRELLTITDFVKTDKQLNTLTGLPTFALLNTLVFLLTSFKTDKRVHILSLYKWVFLTFMKLKLNLS